jgi:hypothetical protein
METSSQQGHRQTRNCSNFVLFQFTLSKRLAAFDPQPLASGCNPELQNDRQLNGDVKVFTKKNWCGSVTCFDLASASCCNRNPPLSHVKIYLKAILSVVSLILTC